MKDIIQRIFCEYGFVNKWHDDVVDFFSPENVGKSSFFLLDYIDASQGDVSATSLKERLCKLELDYEYEDEGSRGIKQTIKGIFDDINVAAQIDKNTSAIYLVKLESIELLKDYRNVIYSVEESPYHFRKFVLPYTDKQLTELKSIISNHPEKNLIDVFSDVADQEKDYFDLATHKNLDSAYELVIRLFSKIPFLQYQFMAEQKPVSVEKRVEDELSNKLLEYHKLICNKCQKIEEYIGISDYEIPDDLIENELNIRLTSKE